MDALEELARWIEYLVERFGIVKTLLGPLTIVSALSVFGVSITGEEGRAALFAVTICGVVTVVVALSVRVRLLRAEVATKNTTLAHYSRVLETHASLEFEFITWDEKVMIGRNGDTIIERKVRIRPLAYPLLFCWTATESLGEELGQAERRRVSHEVRWISDNGELSSRLVTTSRWDGNRNAVYAYFDEAVQAGADVWLYFKWVWPRYSPLARSGSPERFSWFMRRRCRVLMATIQILPDADLVHDLRASALNGMLGPSISAESDGSKRVELKISNPPSGRRFGFVLDTTKRASLKSPA